MPRGQTGEDSIVAEAQRLERLGDERQYGRGVNSDGQVDARLRVGLGRVYAAAREVQHAPSLEAQVARRREIRRTEHVSTAQNAGWYVGMLVHVPRLGPLDLEDQHIMVVVVGQEAL